jgi:hypothetical protein
MPAEDSTSLLRGLLIALIDENFRSGGFGRASKADARKRPLHRNGGMIWYLGAFWLG